MGFFDLKVTCVGCDRTVGLNRFQLRKDTWLCPACEKKALKKLGGWQEFDKLQQMSIEDIKHLIYGTPRIYSNEEIQEMLDIISEEQHPEKQKSNKQQINLSIADEIKKFKELLDMGAITQEEFDKKKCELLNL